VRDTLPGGAEDDSGAACARNHQLAFNTLNFDFADISNYPPSAYFVTVGLQLPDDATSIQVNVGYAPSAKCCRFYAAPFYRFREDPDLKLPVNFA